MIGFDLGSYKIKCIKVGGVTLTNYGQYEFSEDEEIDLLDSELPDTIRVGNYLTAQNMCEDIGFEIAQRIQAGEFEITERKRMVF